MQATSASAGCLLLKSQGSECNMQERVDKHAFACLRLIQRQCFLPPMRWIPVRFLGSQVLGNLIVGPYSKEKQKQLRDLQSKS